VAGYEALLTSKRCLLPAYIVVVGVGVAG